MKKKSFNKIIMGDETWCFAHDPETKRQSSNWVGEISPRPKKLKFRRSRIKKMLTIFSTLKAQCTKNSYRRGKDNKFRILYRSNGSPPEAH